MEAPSIEQMPVAAKPTSPNCLSSPTLECEVFSIEVQFGDCILAKKLNSKSFLNHHDPVIRRGMRKDSNIGKGGDI